MQKDKNPAKAAEYDAVIQSLPNTRESAKQILDLSATTEYVLVVDHPHEDSMTVATHMSVGSVKQAICTLMIMLTQDGDFPPLPVALRELGVSEKQARKIVIATAVLDEFGLTADDLDVIAGVLKRKHLFRSGPTSVEV